jgi:hypothetical protein
VVGLAITEVLKNGNPLVGQKTLLKKLIVSTQEPMRRKK